jgi:GDP-L-fucose synthase
MAVNTMEAARLAGVTRYVNLLAGCMYPGDPADGILRESEVDRGALHPSADNYGISKRVALLQAKHYAAQYGMNITSVVLANTYGPGDHFSVNRSHVVGALLRKFFEAVRTEAPEVTVWGRGLAERDLLYVDDAVVGTLLTVEREPETELLNIGTGIGVPVADIAQTIAQVIGYEGRIVFDASKPEGPLKKTLDITRLRQLVGWEPQTSLEDGIRKTLAWLQANYEAAFAEA